MIYIHIGHPKTGTSAIQALMHLNKDLLFKNKYIYTHCSDFSQPYQTSSGNASFIVQNILENTPEIAAEIIEKSIKTNYNQVFSSEMLSLLLLDRKKRDCFYKIFKNHRFKIIIYLRDQVQYTESIYAQTVRNHNNVENIDDFFTNSKNINLFGSSKYAISDEECNNYGIHNFSNMVIELVDDIGIKNVCLKLYEKEQFIGGNIYSDFLECIGLKLTEEYVMPQKYVNPSFNYDILQYRRYANMFNYDTDIDGNKNKINKLLLDYSSKKETLKNNNKLQLLTKNQQTLIRETFKKDNTKISELFFDNKEMFENNKIYAYEKKQFTINDCISISKFMLNKIGIIDVEEKLKKQIVDFSLNTVVTTEVPGTNLINTYSFDVIPLNVSKDVEKIEFIKNGLFIKSSGNDPHFLLPNLINETAKKMFIIIELEYNKNTNLQIFYKSKDEGFSEKNSTSVGVKAGMNRYVVFIEHNETIEQIRLDPGNEQGEYVISALEIYAIDF